MFLSMGPLAIILFILAAIAVDVWVLRRLYDIWVRRRAVAKNRDEAHE
jgi:isoprenylcysteine carboxyl methyltransferase (ICMT) family protein YpbQ